MTPGCTIEACALRDEFPTFNLEGTDVFGISADSVQSHERFALSYSITFALLADTEKEVIRAYGAWGKKKFMGRTYMGIRRMSFLIGPDGTILKIYEKVKPLDHAYEVLDDIRNLRAKK